MTYPLEKCAAEALIGDTIECTEYSLRIPLSYLIPDLLLTDLPPHLTVDLAQFQFNPEVSSTYTILLQKRAHGRCTLLKLGGGPTFKLLILCTTKYSKWWAEHLVVV